MRTRVYMPGTVLVAIASLLAPVCSIGQVASPQDSQKSMQAQAERAGVIAERGAQAHYTEHFDLHTLPRYGPGKQLTGWLLIHGNNYLADGMLGEYWKRAFAQYQPGIRISYYL